MEVIESIATLGGEHEDLQAVMPGHDSEHPCVVFTTGHGSRPLSGVFTPSDALNVFNVNFLDYEFARMWILKRLHPEGALCPGCGVAIPDNRLRRFWSNERLSCRNCGKYFTALTGTFMSGCQMDFRAVMLLAFLIALGIGDRRIAAIIQMSPENVRLWRMKFNAHTRLASKEDP